MSHWKADKRFPIATQEGRDECRRVNGEPALAAPHPYQRETDEWYAYNHGWNRELGYKMEEEERQASSLRQTI